MCLLSKFTRKNISALGTGIEPATRRSSVSCFNPVVQTLYRANCQGTDATAGHELPELAIITKYDRYIALLRSFGEKTFFFEWPERPPRATFGGLAGHFLPAGRRLGTIALTD